jgi:hypothetical protein
MDCWSVGLGTSRNCWASPRSISKRSENPILRRLGEGLWKSRPNALLLKSESGWSQIEGAAAIKSSQYATTNRYSATAHDHVLLVRNLDNLFSATDNLLSSKSSSPFFSRPHSLCAHCVRFV